MTVAVIAVTMTVAVNGVATVVATVAGATAGKGPRGGSTEAGSNAAQVMR